MGEEEAPTSQVDPDEGAKVGMAMRIAGVEITPEEFDRNPKAQIQRATELLNLYPTMDQLQDVYTRTMNTQPKGGVSGTMTIPPRDHPLTKMQARKEVDEFLDKLSLQDMLALAHHYETGPFDPEKYRRKRRAFKED